MTYKFEVYANGHRFKFGEFIFDEREANKLASKLIQDLGCIEVVISRRAGETEGDYHAWLTVKKPRFQDLPYGYLKRK